MRFGRRGCAKRRRAAQEQEPPGIRYRGTAFARQPRGFSRDKSLERVRAEPAVAVLKDIAASEESGKPAVAPLSTLTGPRPVIQSFQCNEFSNRNHIA